MVRLLHSSHLTARHRSGMACMSGSELYMLCSQKLQNQLQIFLPQYPLSKKCGNGGGGGWGGRVAFHDASLFHSSPQRLAHTRDTASCRHRCFQLLLPYNATRYRYSTKNRVEHVHSGHRDLAVRQKSRQHTLLLLFVRRGAQREGGTALPPQGTWIE